MYTLGSLCMATASTVPDMKMRQLILSSSPTYQRSQAVSNIGLTSSAACPSTNQLQYRLCSTQASARYSESEGDEAEEILEANRIDVISKQNIKPFAPTPYRLRTYKLSILDQLFPHIHVPMVFFYANPDQTTANISGLVAERSKILKKSLSEILTIYYPFAGELSNNREIDCNDQGVYYVETRVDDRLSDFLAWPNYKCIHRLLPYDPSSLEMEKPLGSHVVMVQTNFFKCGSLAISMCTSHKIIDGNTYMEFLRAWATVARGDSSEVLRPSFASPLIFPANPNLPEHSSLVMWPTMFKQAKFTTRRLVFNAAALDALRAKIKATGASDQFGHRHVTSRVVAVTSLVWKCATAASRVRHGLNRRSVLSMAVNLRPRSSPPLSQQSVGNLVWSAVAQWMPDKEVNLDSMAGHVKSAIYDVNSDMVEDLKGEKGTHKIQEHLERFAALYADGETDYYGITSCCKLGENDHDFGWGKPSWTCIGNVGADVPFLSNLIFLMDSSSGDGIEAWVTLSEEDMGIFQNDPELLSFACVDPSPFNN